MYIRFSISRLQNAKIRFALHLMRLRQFAATNLLSINRAESTVSGMNFGQRASRMDARLSKRQY